MPYLPIACWLDCVLQSMFNLEVRYMRQILTVFILSSGFIIKEALQIGISAKGDPVKKN